MCVPLFTFLSASPSPWTALPWGSALGRALDASLPDLPVGDTMDTEFPSSVLTFLTPIRSHYCPPNQCSCAIQVFLLHKIDLLTVYSDNISLQWQVLIITESLTTLDGSPNSNKDSRPRMTIFFAIEIENQYQFDAKTHHHLSVDAKTHYHLF